MLHMLIFVSPMLSLGANQLQKYLHNNQRPAGFSSVTIRFVLLFFPSLPLLFRNRWYLSKRPALGSWLMGPSSWTSSLHLAQPHLLQIANKKCFFSCIWRKRGRGGLCLRWDGGRGVRKRRMRNPGLITSFSAVIFCEAHLVLYQRKKEWSSRAFSFALLHYSF